MSCCYQVSLLFGLVIGWMVPLNGVAEIIAEGVLVPAIGSGLEMLPEPRPDVSGLFVDECIARGGNFSSFLIADRKAVVTELGDLVPSDYTTAGEVRVRGPVGDYENRYVSSGDAGDENGSPDVFLWVYADNDCDRIKNWN